jgi:hypothetical protein
MKNNYIIEVIHNGTTIASFKRDILRITQAAK